jgi:triacylglycerol esterase/lipase EstA (alpha/beta hydrolase family)
MIAVALVVIILALAGVAGLIGLLCLIAAIVMASFILAAAHASPQPSDPAPRQARRIRLWCGEIVVAWAIMLIFMPLERWLMRRSIPGLPSGPGPVLLIHGYVNNAGALFILWRAIKAAGHGTYTVNLEPVYADIDAYADLLEGTLARVQAAEHGRRVALVCHSMGGLAARAYLRKYGAGRVARVITLGTPHGGTELARIALGANGRQMRTGSAWLAALAAQEHGTWPCPFLSIYSRDDNIVAPQLSARLEGARNIALDGIGHVTLPMAKEVARLVVTELSMPAPAGSGDGEAT